MIRRATIGLAVLGATLFPIQGIMLGGAYERFQENLAVKGTERNTFIGQLNIFPYAHVELVLLFRYLIDPAATLGMVQLHYYL